MNKKTKNQNDYATGYVHGYKQGRALGSSTVFLKKSLYIIAILLIALVVVTLTVHIASAQDTVDWTIGVRTDGNYDYALISMVLDENYELIEQNVIALPGTVTIYNITTTIGYSYAFGAWCENAPNIEFIIIDWQIPGTNYRIESIGGDHAVLRLTPQIQKVSAIVLKRKI